MMNAAVSDSKVLVNFLNANGEKAGAPLEIPLDTTTSQLQVNIIYLRLNLLSKYLYYYRRGIGPTLHRICYVTRAMH